MVKCPPKTINSFVGYRTSRSQKSPEAWQFAHACCGRLWIKIGAVLLPISALVQFPFRHADTDTLGVLALVLEGIQIAVLLASILPVEQALKREFDESGKPRR